MDTGDNDLKDTKLKEFVLSEVKKEEDIDDWIRSNGKKVCSIICSIPIIGSIRYRTVCYI